MRRLLVGTDGSATAAVAVRWATRLALATGAELVVASAWQPGQAEVSPDEYTTLRDEATARLEGDWTATARTLGATPRVLLLDGDPREQLFAAAEREDVDLLIAGARGGGSHPHALHLGSVAHHLAHHTTRPLALVPAGSPISFSRVLVALDGSEASMGALRWCRDVAADLGSHVVAVYCEQPLAEWVPHSDRDSWFQEATDELAGWAKPLHDAGIATTELVVDRTPVMGLAETAVREEAGFLVLGTRGIGGITGLRLGSTALKVLHQTTLPVVVVPPPA